MRGSSVVALIVGLLAVFMAVGAASAHVTVWPKQSAPGSYEKYTVRVPTEKEIPTVKVEVQFPADLSVTSFEPKPGWTYEVEKDATGRITGVVWSGGKIGPNEFDEFAFIAANPKQPGTLAFKAYQTYADGSVVAWEGPPDSEHPASVTTITASISAVAGTVEQVGTRVAQTGASGNRGRVAAQGQTDGASPLGLTGTFWLSVAAVALGLTGVVLAGLALRQRMA